jgi:hypothetical protein
VLEQSGGTIAAKVGADCTIALELRVSAPKFPFAIDI